MSRYHSFTRLAASIALCLLVGLIGNWFTQTSLLTWYPTLVKPAWTPPNWVFGPTWTVLYITMGISLWLVWKAPSTRPKTTAYIAFGLQLLVNLVWSLLFFFLRCPLCGFADIVILLALIATTIISFYRITPLAGYLLIPYLLWVAYATTLNAAIVILNHQ